MYSKGDPSVSDELFDLAREHDTRVTHFSSYMVNGWRFNTRIETPYFKHKTVEYFSRPMKELEIKITLVS
jgi:hypothetical protein